MNLDPTNDPNLFKAKSRRRLVEKPDVVGAIFGRPRPARESLTCATCRSRAAWIESASRASAASPRGEIRIPRPRPVRRASSPPPETIDRVGLQGRIRVETIEDVRQSRRSVVERAKSCSPR